MSIQTNLPDLVKSFETLKLSIDLYSAVDPESVFGYSVRKAIDEKRTLGAIMMVRDQCLVCPGEMQELLGEELYLKIKSFERPRTY